MKRILAILCVIACLCGLCIPAMAAGTITVSVKAPAEWTEVFLYVWDNDNNAYEGWPGKAMTKGADGWWTIEVPAGYTNVIAGNGNEKPQTVDLKMDGSSDAWITVGEDTGDGKHFNATVAKDASGTPSTPSTPSNPGAGMDLSGLNSLALAGEGMPGFVEGWNPGAPAGDMVKESNGVYTKVVTVLAGTAAMFKIAGNDEWNDAYNLGCAEKGTPVVIGTKMELINGGGSQDIALNVDKDCNLKFTVDLTGDVPTLLVEETDEEPGVTPPSDPGTDVPTGETYTVYAMVPEDWKNPSVWCWDGNAQNPSNLGAWPGTFTMTKGADGWYSIEIPVGYTNILINANGGGNQTPDITGLSGQDVWVNALTDPNAPVFKYELITDIEQPTAPPTVEATIRPTSGLNGDKDQDGEKGGKDLTVLLAIVGSVVIIAVAAVVFIIVKGKKKAA